MLTKYSKMEMIEFILHTIKFDDSAKLIECFCWLSYNNIYYASDEFEKGVILVFVCIFASNLIRVFNCAIRIKNIY